MTSKGRGKYLGARYPWTGREQGWGHWTNHCRQCSYNLFYVAFELFCSEDGWGIKRWLGWGMKVTGKKPERGWGREIVAFYWLGSAAPLGLRAFFCFLSSSCNFSCCLSCHACNPASISCDSSTTRLWNRQENSVRNIWGLSSAPYILSLTDQSQRFQLENDTADWGRGGARLPVGKQEEDGKMCGRMSYYWFLP